MLKIIKSLGLLLLLGAMLLPSNALAAPTLTLDPTQIIAKAGTSDKKIVKVSLSDKPSVTVKVTVKAPKGIALGKSELVFTPENYNQSGAKPDDHNFGVTLTSDAKNGQQLPVTLEGKIGSQKITATLAVSVSATGASNSGSVTSLTGEELAGADIKLSQILPAIIRWALTIIAIGGFLGLVYSGFMFITAGGDPSKAQLAQKNIVWSLTGIALALLSFVIVQIAANVTTVKFPAGRKGGTETAGSPSLPPLDSRETKNYVLTDSFGVPLNEYLVSDPKVAFSTKIGVRLDRKPTSDVGLSITAEGNLNVQPLQSILIIAQNDWQKVYYIPVTYDGKGELGERGRIVVTVGKEKRSVLFRTDEGQSPLEQPPKDE